MAAITKPNAARRLLAQTLSANLCKTKQITRGLKRRNRQ
jgi:hypothetical protein